MGHQTILPGNYLMALPPGRQQRPVAENDPRAGRQHYVTPSPSVRREVRRLWRRASLAGCGCCRLTRQQRNSFQILRSGKRKELGGIFSLLNENAGSRSLCSACDHAFHLSRFKTPHPIDETTKAPGGRSPAKVIRTAGRYDANHCSGLIAFCLKRNSKYNPGPLMAG